MLGLAHLIGRPYLLQLRELHPWLASVTTADGCCNRGVVVPADMYGPLADFLEVRPVRTAGPC